MCTLPLDVSRAMGTAALLFNGETEDEFYARRRVDSRSTSLGGISIFCVLIGDFDPILASRSSAASIPIWQVPWSMVVSGTDNTSE